MRFADVGALRPLWWQVDTLKRCCFKQLPPTLVLHLKRFELNFDTMAKQKINSKCTFPTSMNLFRYTAEGMAAPHAAEGECDQQAASPCSLPPGDGLMSHQVPSVFAGSAPMLAHAPTPTPPPPAASCSVTHPHIRVFACHSP
jgi:hypothetical protein